MAVVTIDAREWARLALELRAFEPALALGLRRRLKAAGDKAKAQIKGALAESPPSGGGSSVGVRRALAAATRTSVSFASRGAGVKIVTSGSRLPAGRSAMLKAYNTDSWRHPVYGGGQWVSQPGRPYFNKEIMGLIPEITSEVEDALADAMRMIGARAL